MSITHVMMYCRPARVATLLEMVAKARKKLTAATTTSMDDVLGDDDDDDDALGDAAVATGNQKGRRLGLDDVRKDNDGGADHDHHHHDDDEDDDKYDTSVGHGSDARLMKPFHLIPRRNNISHNNSNSSSLHSLPSTHNHPPLPSFPLKTSSSSIPLPPLSQSNIDLLTNQHHKKKPSTKTSKSSGNSKPSSLEPHVKRVDNHHRHGHDHHDTHHNNRIDDNHNATTAAAVRRRGHKVHSKGNVDPSIAPTVSSTSTSFIRIDTNKASNHYEHHTSDKMIPPIISIISNEQPQTLSPAQQKELERKKKAHDLLQSLYYKHVESSEDEYDEEEEGDDDDDIEGSSDALEAEYLRLREEFNRKIKLAASMNAATAYALAQSHADRGEKKGLTDGNNNDDDAPVSIRNCDRFDGNRADSSTDSSFPTDDGLDHHHHHQGSEENNSSSPFVHTSGSVTTSYSSNNRQISTSELLKVWQMEDRMMDEHRVDDDANRMDDDKNHLGSPDHDEDSHYKEDEDEDVDDHAIKTVNSSRSSKSSRQSTATATAVALDDVQCLALLQRLSQKIEL